MVVRVYQLKFQNMFDIVGQFTKFITIQYFSMVQCFQNLFKTLKFLNVSISILSTKAFFNKYVHKRKNWREK